MLFCVKKEKKCGLQYRPFCVLALLTCVLFFISGIISDSNLEHSKEVLDNALTRSITQCYSLEGTYPPNLQYLENHYGLIYDKTHFYIDYKYIGSNLRPDVTIIEKD